MQIVIPMTGHGSRFKAAGFDRLKPFIEVHGAPMIEWVVRMFPGASDRFLFICRSEHLESLDYIRPTLRRIAPHARIHAVDDWQKLGPVNDVLRAGDLIDDSLPVIVSYCDYYMHWDYPAFEAALRTRAVDGSVPCYTGFHPHLLPAANLYASCKTDPQDILLEIREKFSWTEDKTQSRHSPGAYHFASGALLKHYFQRQLRQGQAINGEHYCSLPYNLMVADGLRVWCPANVTRFCQWGTPEDLADHLYWTDRARRSLA